MLGNCISPEVGDAQRADHWLVTLKKRGLELHAQDPEANKVFIMYHQGGWRIAYFEDDRDLMEAVLATPAMQETTNRLLGGSSKRQATLDDCVGGA